MLKYRPLRVSGGGVWGFSGSTPIIEIWARLRHSQAGRSLKSRGDWFAFLQTLQAFAFERFCIRTWIQARALGCQVRLVHSHLRPSFEKFRVLGLIRAHG